MSASTLTPSAPGTAPAAPGTRRKLPSWFGAWEISLTGLVVIALIAATVNVPFFLGGQNFSVTAAATLGLALMVVPMTGLMIAGEIDLSIASVFGLAGVVFGLSIEAGMPLVLALATGLATGVAAGLINGWITVTFNLPSLVVTVGTLGAFRGIAYILLESRSISSLPSGFTTFAQGNVPGTYIPYGFLVFVAVAVVMAVVLHRSSFGRKTFAVGSSPEVSRYSGIRVRRVKLTLFVLSGAFAALAGMLYSGYVSSVRADNGTGLELSVIAIVLIGGVSMFGGKGSFAGVLLSLLLVTVLTSWMNLNFVATNLQYTVIGLLMIGAVVVPVLVTRLRDRAHRSG
jgi:rhamnose transport system permease protein